MFGDYIVVGVNSTPNQGETYSGQVYIYKNDGTDNWNELAILTASNQRSLAFFGSSVSIDSNCKAVGAPGTSSSALDIQGQVYIFRKDSTDNWHEVEILESNDKLKYFYFGSSVYLSGNKVIVSQSYSLKPAYLFSNDSKENWDILDIIKPNNGSQIVPKSVFILDDYYLIGGSGEVYIFW